MSETDIIPMFPSHLPMLPVFLHWLRRSVWQCLILAALGLFPNPVCWVSYDFTNLIRVVKC